jgi:ring-1,2-phenylacetyl-CoA epoxidase subunit PaaD
LRGQLERTDMLNEQTLWEALETVMDPEIPTISMVDMGIITAIKLSSDQEKAFVEMTPTFSGCPAIREMEKMVKERMLELGIKEVEVRTTFNKPWNSNLITERGRQHLKKHGLAPPPKHEGEITQELLENIECPFCGSKNVDLKSAFGPTLCRSLHYCNNCLQAFEQFKPVV